MENTGKVVAIIAGLCTIIAGLYAAYALLLAPKPAELEGVGLRDTPDNSGAEITSVVPLSPAWDSGLRIGDVINYVGHRRVQNRDEVHSSLADNHKAGESILVRVERQGQQINYWVVASAADT